MENVIIIGTGCAGYTSAIYTGRANLRPLVLAGTQPGGQLTTTTEVENFPGFPEGVQGPELMMKMMAQAQKFGARFEYETVTSITKDVDDGGFTVVTDTRTHRAKAVIVATGASPRHLGLPDEQRLIGHGLTSCATCDGAVYRDVPVCVIGGDSACEEATFLTRFASKVYLIHRRDELRASKIMAERALANPKIEPVWNSTIIEYVTDAAGEMTQVRLQNLLTGEESSLDLKCVFVAIGHVPNTAFLGGLAGLDENGYILHHKGMMTNVDGLFAAGDVADHVWRQAITAAGQGCAAAIEVERYLADVWGE